MEAKGKSTETLFHFLQQNKIKLPDPELQTGEASKLMGKWYRQHCEIEYIMDTTNKTEKIAAPKGKHDDYCDSAVLGIHGSLSMLPGEANFSNVTISARNPRARANANHFATTRRRNNRSMQF